MEQTLEQQFASMTGKDTVIDLIRHLSNANGRLPAFALPDTIDAINTLGQLCRTHSRTQRHGIQDRESRHTFLKLLIDQQK